MKKATTNGIWVLERRPVGKRGQWKLFYAFPRLSRDVVRGHAQCQNAADQDHYYRVSLYTRTRRG